MEVRSDASFGQVQLDPGCLPASKHREPMKTGAIITGAISPNDPLVLLVRIFTHNEQKSSPVLRHHLGGMRMPPSTRMVSAFM
jgi:hypothetical protein